MGTNRAAGQASHSAAGDNETAAARIARNIGAIVDPPPLRTSGGYLLGLYLGDGCLSVHRRGVYHLRIVLDARYPGILDECAWAMAVVSGGRRVGRQPGRGCVIVNNYWKHWVCVFPQHGRGKKYTRPIRLTSWQQEIASSHPDRLLRGLIHSDGCRVENRVNGKTYPRYLFRNKSADILAIFCRACEDYGLSWTRPTIDQLSVARAADVAKLDEAIGPKR